MAYQSNALLKQVVDCSVNGSSALQITRNPVDWDIRKHLHYARHGWVMMHQRRVLDRDTSMTRYSGLDIGMGVWTVISMRLSMKEPAVMVYDGNLVGRDSWQWNRQPGKQTLNLSRMQ